MTRCICGKKTKLKANGQMGKTCKNPSCAGKLSKKHMLEVMNTSAAIVITGRDFTPNY